MSRWRTIPGLPRYEASDDGQIRSKARSITVGKGKESYRKLIPGKVLKLTPTVWRGRPHYMSVPIQGKTHLVHRLVAMTWLTSTWFEGAEVNHRDGNKRNNRISNLEWVTRSENELHSYRVLGKRRKPSQSLGKPSQGVGSTERKSLQGNEQNQTEAAQTRHVPEQSDG